ncbi:ABC transporter ATP-binding protein [Demequina aurantiaca]|uniref:ABC transporter ATP-binding protein n=1 Tax=Demequina aurantiaca TaxID=676200 RepID=UPI0007828EB0|nr:ABC transporter ATP-binding protein [Demequina aurantiaca]
MIEFSDVTLTYPDGSNRVTAVNQVSLTAVAGTVTCITGPSGSGKSSLLALGATLIQPDSGRILINGTDAGGLSTKDASALRREQVGIVFQQANLLPSLTALEQLTVMNELGTQGARARRPAAGRRATEILATVGLADQAHKRPHQLSGGQRQRINIARALMNRPSILLVDEPTSSLDQERGSQIIDIVLDLTASEGTSTLLVTHDTSHFARMERVVEMMDGRLVDTHARAARSAKSDET